MQHFQLFYPYEQLDDINEIDLLFSQIITDCRKPNRHRIRQYEKDEINKILRKFYQSIIDLNLCLSNLFLLNAVRKKYVTSPYSVS